MRRVRIARWVLPLGLAIGGCTLTLPFDSLRDEKAIEAGASRKPDVVTPPKPTPKPPTPTSQWSFEEGSGDQVADTFRLHPGVLHNDGPPAGWTTGGKRGGGLDFGPVGDAWMAVSSLGGSAAAFPKEGTVAMWVNARTLGTEGPELFVVDDPRGKNNEQHAPFGVYYNKELVTFELQAPFPPDASAETFEDESFYSSANAEPIPVKTWGLVIVGWSTVTRKATLMVHIEGKEPTAVKTADFPPGWDLKAPTVAFGALDAVLDEIRFYDRLLTEAEMAAID